MNNENNANKVLISLIIRAIRPYIRINSDTLLTEFLTRSIDISDVPGELTDIGEQALFAVVWNSLQEKTVGILPHWEKYHINEITYKLSKSNKNPTWYCNTDSGKTIYIRQSNKTVMTSVHPEIETMEIGDVARDVSITIYVEDDGSFLVPKRVLPGRFHFVGQTKEQRQRNLLDKLLRLENYVFLDFETNGLPDDSSSEILSFGIIRGNKSEYGLVQPEDLYKNEAKPRKGKAAIEINGLTRDMLEDAPTFPEIYPILKVELEGRTVITYGEFEVKMLQQVCNRHDLDMISFDHFDLMTWYAEYAGELNARGGYKYQKLASAYEKTTLKEFMKAHHALEDCKAMAEIVKTMIARYVPF